MILPPGCELSKSCWCQNALCIEKTPNFDLGDRQVALENQFFSADHAKQVIARFGFIISNKFVNFFQNGAFYVSLELAHVFLRIPDFHFQDPDRRKQNTYYELFYYELSPTLVFLSISP